MFIVCLLSFIFFLFCCGKIEMLMTIFAVNYPHRYRSHHT